MRWDELRARRMTLKMDWLALKKRHAQSLSYHDGLSISGKTIVQKRWVDHHAKPL
jgi:hypothetical protein